MAQLEIPQKYAADLDKLARSDARPVEDVVSEAMDAYLSFRFSEGQLTSSQIDQLKQGLAQAESGELVSEETIEAFFEDWEKEASSR